MKSFGKKTVCLLLALVMVLTLGCPVFAAEQETFKYVAIGDSFATGYGLPEYKPSAVNTGGFLVPVEGSYPALLRDALEKKYGAGNVELTQLSVTGMRVYETHMFLDDSFEPDAVFNKHDSRFSVVGSADLLVHMAEAAGFENAASATDLEVLNAVRDFYQQSVSEADLITMSLGCNSITTGLQMTRLDESSADDPENLMAKLGFNDCYLDFLKKARTEIAKLIPGHTPDMDKLINNMLYVIVDSTLNYDACIRHIYELNPEVEIVVLPIEHTIYDNVYVEYEGHEIPLGKLNSLMLDFVSEYQSFLSPYADTYKYADSAKQFKTNSILDDAISSKLNKKLNVETKNYLFNTLQNICNEVEAAATETNLTVASWTNVNLDVKTLLAYQKGQEITDNWPKEEESIIVTTLRTALQQPKIYYSFEPLNADTAADVASYLWNGTLANGAQDAVRLKNVQAYLCCQLGVGKTAIGPHSSKEGHQAKADAVLYALDSRMNSREYKSVEHYLDYKDYREEKKEEYKEFVEETKETIRVYNEAVKTAVQIAIPIVRDAIVSVVEETMTKVGDWFKSFFK